MLKFNKFDYFYNLIRLLFIFDLMVQSYFFSWKCLVLDKKHLFEGLQTPNKRNFILLKCLVINDLTDHLGVGFIPQHLLR